MKIYVAKPKQDMRGVSKKLFYPVRSMAEDKSRITIVNDKLEERSYKAQFFEIHGSQPVE